MPYVVLHPIDEVPSKKTNANIYYRMRFAIELYTENWEDNSTILPHLVNAFKYAPLTFINASVLKIEEAPVRYLFLQKELKWRGTAEMSALVGRTADYVP